MIAAFNLYDCHAEDSEDILDPVQMEPTAPKVRADNFDPDRVSGTTKSVIAQRACDKTPGAACSRGFKSDLSDPRLVLNTWFQNGCELVCSDGDGGDVWGLTSSPLPCSRAAFCAAPFVRPFFRSSVALGCAGWDRI